MISPTDLVYQQQLCLEYFTKFCKLCQSNVINLYIGQYNQHFALVCLFSFAIFFHNCAVIIDCTEVFIEQPSDLLACSQTWSQYKHHDTVKFLIGIIPQGTISFLMKKMNALILDKAVLLLHRFYRNDIFNLRDEKKKKKKKTSRAIAKDHKRFCHATYRQFIL